jgi:hypothetical protein
MKMQSAVDPELCVFDEQFSFYKFQENAVNNEILKLQKP